MLAFCGKVVYPENVKQEQLFEEVTEAIAVKKGILPPGTYTLEGHFKNKKPTIYGKMEVTEDNKLVLKKGAVLNSISPKVRSSFITEGRKNMKIENNVLQEDYVCSSPSIAAGLIYGINKNGWNVWKDENGNYIDIYRKQHEKDDEENNEE